MAEGRRLKTEHAGAKNGGGYWGHRADAKRKSNRRRRAEDRATVAQQAEPGFVSRKTVVRVDPVAPAPTHPWRRYPRA